MTAVVTRSGPPDAVFAREPASPSRASRPAPTLPEVGDLQSALFAAQAAMKNTRSKSAMMSAEGAQLAREHAIDEARAAVAKALEEQRDAEEKGSWIKTLRTVGTIAAVVVAAASVVCSAGISAPAAVALVGVALSVSSPYIAEATGSQKLGLALALVGAAMSLGAGIYSAAISSATTMTTAQQAAIVAGRVTSGSAEVASGVVTIEKGEAEARAQEARADATRHRSEVEEQQAVVDDAIALLDDIEKKSRRAIASILAIGQTESVARNTTVTNMRRA